MRSIKVLKHKVSETYAKLAGGSRVAYSACWVCGNSSSPLVDVPIDRTKRRVCGACAEMYKPKPPVQHVVKRPTNQEDNELTYIPMFRPTVVGI